MSADYSLPTRNGACSRAEFFGITPDDQGRYVWLMQTLDGAFNEVVQ